jgi:tetratricopeptide (TPR) repeat protein/SAM-dependent methyltransferase
LAHILVGEPVSTSPEYALTNGMVVMNRKERRAAGKQRGGEVASLFAAAVGHHQAGQLAQAEHLYRGVLAVDPHHGRALYYLGVLSAQTRRFEAAADLIGRAAALNPREPEVRYNLAAAYQECGRLDQAVAEYRQAIALKPDYGEAYMNLGNVSAELGRPAEAVHCYDRVLALDPRSAAAHYNAANVLARAGDFAAATARYGAAIELQPDLAEAHNNLGNALKSQDRLDEAEAAYRHALGLKPDYADAHNNLGVILTARGAAEEGISHYRQALQARAGFTEAHNNLGLALFRQGRYEEAVGHFEKAVALDPTYVDAYLNLARQFYAAGDVEQAVGVAARAIQVSGTPDARHLFGMFAGALHDGTAAEKYRDLIARAVSEGWTRTSDLERVSLLLVKKSTAIAAALAALPRAPGAEELAALAEDRLLHSLMVSARVSDPDLERLLTAIRRTLLEETIRPGGEVPALDFACALSRQCFINEYVFAETADERAAVRALADTMVERLRTGGEIPAFWPSVVGSYAPLHAMPGSGGLLERSWPAPVAEVLTQQIREPVEEQEIRRSLPVLTPIDDEISRKVQDQYEENPYPRWIAAPPPVTAYSLGEYLRMKFPLAPLRPLRLSGGADVLIAGCGTGAHAIETCRRISGARILAIDLSRTSLSYAIRKSRALGLPIEYAQADILKLDRIGRTFDLIEASGVLHHLADPMAGWRILLSLLRPGGVMSVGLYSGLARSEINAARAFIAQRGYRPTAQDIRRARQDILSFAEGMPGRAVARSGDFYSMSGCRDLLFHVQEHQHTLPEIAAFLAAHELQFLGFDLDTRALKLYAQANPDDPDMIDLTRWDAFERANPQVFAAMYQFVVQKR